MTKRHTSVALCPVGVDLLVTQIDTGRVIGVRWKWEDVEKFVLEHGEDLTAQARELLDTTLPKG